MDASQEYLNKKLDKTGKITSTQAKYAIELAKLEGGIDHITKWQPQSTLQARLGVLKEALGIK